MVSLMYADMGISAAASLGNFIGSSAADKTAAVLQRYRRTMQALSAAQAQNDITKNEVATRDQNILQAAAEQINEMETTEAARVSAAAAGVAGDSVDASLTSIARKAAQQRLARTRAFTTEAMRSGQQRRQVQMDLAYNREQTVIPKTSIGNALLGFGMDAVDIWDQHNPTSLQSSTILRG